MAVCRPPIVLPSALSPLLEQSRWVVWKWVTGKNGKRTKPPYQGSAPEKFASSTDPATWCSFEMAAQAYSAGQADGVGFALPGSGFGAFDIDHCRDATSGSLTSWASDLVQRCGSYAEVTPSGTGVRIIGTASGPLLHRKLAVPGTRDVSVEIYRDAERYITVSGAQIGEASGLASIDVHIDAVMSKLAGKANSGHDLGALIRDGCRPILRKGLARSDQIGSVRMVMPPVSIRKVA
jgi:primase-polymerase (primpol)-like protein